jgi:hypothetical protein
MLARPLDVDEVITDRTREGRAHLKAHEALPTSVDGAGWEKAHAMLGDRIKHAAECKRPNTIGRTQKKNASVGGLAFSAVGLAPTVGLEPMQVNVTTSLSGESDTSNADEVTSTDVQVREVTSVSREIGPPADARAELARALRRAVDAGAWDAVASIARALEKLGGSV